MSEPKTSKAAPLGKEVLVIVLVNLGLIVSMAIIAAMGMGITAAAT
ncbi:MAG: hypothetical protein M0026_21890 [Nocardiopsaceae bacterium]|nr:hypothetical protein [Nocardiopsaceae bacterium]